jgi:hypothetical protein
MFENISVMEIFGRYSLRIFLARALIVEWAAKFHCVLLDEILDILKQAVVKKQGNAR